MSIEGILDSMLYILMYVVERINTYTCYGSGKWRNG